MRNLLLFIFIFSFQTVRAQKINSIYFHLYTDSLKKEVHNYINVDGMLSNGKYLPLDSGQIIFSSSTGTWLGNDLIINSTFKGDSVLITATLKANKQLSKSIIVYIKKRNDNSGLKTEEEILNDAQKKNRR